MIDKATAIVDSSQNYVRTDGQQKVEDRREQDRQCIGDQRHQRVQRGQRSVFSRFRFFTTIKKRVLSISVCAHGEARGDQMVLVDSRAER